MARLRLLVFIITAAGLLCARTARAYPWMIRHEYPACAQCHLDPSGGGPLSAYGRGMGEVLLKTRYEARPAGEEEAVEPGPAAKFLWGAVPLPEWFDLGGSFRVASLSDKVDSDELTHRILYMQADLSAALNTNRWVGVATLGYAPSGATYAAITRGPDANLVSRYHWIGYRPDEDATMLLRAGRMDLPFGIRDVMHTLAIRTTTRTNIDQMQQHGVSFAYSGGHARAELMAIFGNFQTRPDEYRERGYSGYFEWIPSNHAAFGLSSRIAHVELDPKVLAPMWRHAHGVFGRVATPFEPLVLLGEVDYVIDSAKELPRKQGIQAMAQADFEFVQGLHYQLTGEAGDFGAHDLEPTYAAWGSFLWFFASHIDVRLDGAYQSLASPSGRVSDVILLVQGHLYL